MKSNALTDKLAAMIDDVLAGRVKPAVAVEVNNAAGKINNNTKNQLLFGQMRGEEVNIPFLSDVLTGIPAGTKKDKPKAA